MVTVRAPVHLQSGQLVDVKLDALDALSVGLSMQVLARNQKTPPGTREIYDRVGKQMASAARSAMTVRR